MMTAIFHFAAFVVLIAGLLVSAALFTGLAIVVAGGGERRQRGPRRPRPARILARTAHFDLAIDG